MRAELVIRGGLVVDGTGAPGRAADVAVAGGRIEEIGPVLEGERTLDATGMVVAPGFIDIHTHYDAQVFWDPELTPSCYHGVTTVVAGNCGFTIAPARPEHRSLVAATLANVEDMSPDSLAAGIAWEFSTFAEYLAAVERRGLGVNFASYAGHTAIRLFVMGEQAYERTATPDEIEQMKGVLRESMLAGAAGFATSFLPFNLGVDGKPVPSRFADRSELEAFLDVMRELGRGVVAVGPGEPCDVADMYELQPGIGVPFTYAGLLAFPNGMHHRLVELNRRGWASGACVWPQVTPRPLAVSMTMAAPVAFNTNELFASLASGSAEDRRRAYADHGWRERAAAAWGRGSKGRAPRWDTYRVTQSAVHPELEERALEAIAAERGAAPLDLLLDLALDEPELGLRVSVVAANDDVDEVSALLVEDHCTIGLSDAGAHLGQLCDAPQATDFLGSWVRERGIMPLEAAVRRLTGLQADLMGFADRGYVRVGAAADVVVFDPETVSPGPLRRVRDFPAGAERLTADQPEGIRHVLVNGSPTHVDGSRLDGPVLPGRIVRPRPPRKGA